MENILRFDHISYFIIHISYDICHMSYEIWIMKYGLLNPSQNFFLTAYGTYGTHGAYEAYETYKSHRSHKSLFGDSQNPDSRPICH